MSHKQKHVGPTSSRVSPPLGALPSQPDSPEVQLPPPEPDLPPIQAVPMTDGTPAACMQKNAKEFLAGNTPGVMAQFDPLRHAPCVSSPRRGAFGRTFRFADIISGSCK